MDETLSSFYRKQTKCEEYIRWLEVNSMLYQAEILSRSYLKSEKKWQKPYALPQPRAVVREASAWLAAYPASMVTAEGQSILATLAQKELWDCLSEIGIKALHTGPTKRAGGLRGKAFTPTIDGSFDRISYDIAPDFGTDIDYLELVHVARSHDAIIIGDVIPGHTGKGADFRLAERNFQDYPGIYHMIQIGQEDWHLLPEVPRGADSANLSPGQVQMLKDKGYIVGELTRIIFYEPGIKESNWSATGEVEGLGGENYRWVYLHYFKDGQPTLNWLDPSFAAQRLLTGDIIDSMRVLGDRGLRLDANGFLGIEVNPVTGKAWSEGHPLSIMANGIISMMVRKLGGFTFQELNLTLEDLKSMSITGADLSYDFVTRPAYHHALATGSVDFLHLMLCLMHRYAIDPAALIHALQNHDELTLELVHFNTVHADALFPYGRKKIKGIELRELIHRDMFTRLAGPHAPYNVAHPNGIVSTTATLCAAVLGIRDIYHMTPGERENVMRLHLLLTMFNAFQPGVFALSGWDLVGALTLRREEAGECLVDGDTRWLNRGGYDLMNVNPHATCSTAGLAKAVTLYGPLPEQMQSPVSFARRLQKMLAVREAYRVPESRQVAIPRSKHKGLLVMIHALPDERGLLATALNFSPRRLQEAVPVRGGTWSRATDILVGSAVDATGDHLNLALEPYEGKVILLD